MSKKSISVILTTVLLVIGAMVGSAAGGVQEGARNAIFFHPDGYGISHWNALRFWLVGPDGRLNWDRLAYMAPYTGHLKDALTASSHGGATTHAYGVKVARDSFGLDAHEVITALSGQQMSIMEEAIQTGYATALVQTGCITEPGTAAFVASVEERDMKEDIARRVIESGVDVILGGGEKWLLPEGTVGRHGEGGRQDGLNLIEEAKELGYTVVYTSEELKAATGTATKILGVFASEHTFNDLTEEELRAEELPLFWLWAPTIAEMSEAALEILSRNPKAAEKGIFIVAEDEATDNFGNSSNARGSFEAGKRADEALGVFLNFLKENPNTLLITAADSDAGAKGLLGPDPAEMDRLLVDGKLGESGFNTRPDGVWAEVPLDGVDGAGSEPFLAMPDKEGNRWPFAVTWVRHDVLGGILARAQGLNAGIVTELGVVDNIDIYRILYYTLFDEWLGEPR
ncbi:MAG TPA: alkaline phosphatase [Atribacteraceae bacterium]|nr:alkaline phosphatase [Atribacteraceae bacterium]